MQRFEAEGIEPLQGDLEKLDPKHYSKMDTKNPQRVIRALEVCLTTGKPFFLHSTNLTTIQIKKPAKKTFRTLFKWGLKRQGKL